MTRHRSPVEHPEEAGSLLDIERRAVRWWYPLLILAGLGGIYLLGEWLGWRDQLRAMERWIDSFGVLGVFVFMAIHIAVTILGVPSSPLTAAAGALFGAAVGTVTALTGSVVAATVSFLIARHLTPASWQRRLRSSRTFLHLNRLVKRRGALVVLATRLINLLPFAVVNYGFGLTRVPLKTYVIWTIVGKIPGTVVLVVGVDLVVEAISDDRLPWAQLVILLVIAIGLAWLVRRARAWLSDDPETDGPNASASAAANEEPR